MDELMSEPTPKARNIYETPQFLALLQTVALDNIVQVSFREQALQTPRVFCSLVYMDKIRGMTP